jgi:sugar O-acyltransferase (sialic acid O-acetyltransferase NeuD family)
MEPILIVGSSWNAGVVHEIVQLGGKYRIIGFLDDTEPVGITKRGYTVLGPISGIAEISEKEKCRSVAITIGDNWWRRKIYRDIAKARPMLDYPPIKHPSAVLALGAGIGQGSVLMAGAHVGCSSKVGMFCIVNTGSSVDHDCKMGDFSSLAPGVFMGGLVEIGECSHIGIGASISDRKKIGAHTVVGTGAVVVRDIPDLSVAYGNPARIKRMRPEGEKYV